MKVDVKYILFAATLSMGLFTSCTSSEEECKLPQSCHGLNMTELPQRWDEAIPLGNGLTGGLLWQKDGNSGWLSTVLIFGIYVRWRHLNLLTIPIGLSATR